MDSQEAFEIVHIWVYEDLLKDFPQGIDKDLWAEEIANRLGKYSQNLADAVYDEAKNWSKNQLKSMDIKS